MFTYGNQIKAARALIGWQQDELAAAAGLHRNAVAYWEGKDVIPTRSEPVGCRRMREALAAAGVVIVTRPAQGLMLCPKRNNVRPNARAHARDGVLPVAC